MAPEKSRRNRPFPLQYDGATAIYSPRPAQMRLPWPTNPRRRLHLRHHRRLSWLHSADVASAGLRFFIAVDEMYRASGFTGCRQGNVLLQYPSTIYGAVQAKPNIRGTTPIWQRPSLENHLTTNPLQLLYGQAIHLSNPPHSITPKPVASR